MGKVLCVCGKLPETSTLHTANVKQSNEQSKKEGLIGVVRGLNAGLYVQASAGLKATVCFRRIMQLVFLSPLKELKKQHQTILKLCFPLLSVLKNKKI